MGSSKDSKAKELASLARLIAFAKQNAAELDAEISAYCLDLALDALKQRIKACGGDASFDIVPQSGGLAIH